jgi:hypothetical protein
MMRLLSTNTFRLVAAAAAVAAVVSSDIPRAQALDFFMKLFGAERSQSAPSPTLNFGSPGNLFAPQAPAASGGGGRSTAYCVRTCDGRYFPISASNEQSHAVTCSSLCPATDTRVFQGSSIDNARGENGKPYSSLPNAFKYREQLVDGCTCNGKSPVGLASINVNEDKTLRKGDIVAGENGLIVASRAVDKKRGRVADFIAAPPSVRAKFERSHAMMRDERRKVR